MGGISIWTLIIVSLLVLPAIVPFYVFRRTSIDRLRPWLGVFFAASIASLVAWIAIYDEQALEAGEQYLVQVTPLLLFSAASWAYLAVLALCAKRLGKSAIKWWGLTFITWPLGYLASYPMMLSRIRKPAPPASD